MAPRQTTQRPAASAGNEIAEVPLHLGERAEPAAVRVPPYLAAPVGTVRQGRPRRGPRFSRPRPPRTIEVPWPAAAVACLAAAAIGLGAGLTSWAAAGQAAAAAAVLTMLGMPIVANCIRPEARP